MRQKLLLILLIAICCNCKRTVDFKVNELVETPGPQAQTDTSAWIIYRSLDSDSLLIEKGEVDSLLSIFAINGQQILRKEYGAGDCEGAYRTFNLKGDTSILTIDKYDCGDYGFGNSQYLTRNDSVLMAREFKVEWYNRTVYTVVEKIIKFKNGKTILKGRETSTSELNDLRFINHPFDENKIILSDEEYERIQKELVEKGR